MRFRTDRLLALLLLAPLLMAQDYNVGTFRPRAPAVEVSLVADFVATPIQGASCVAPCAVHFNAYGDAVTQLTTDPTFSREFHSLLYRWDFGDPGAGEWTRGAQARAGLASPKNTDEGPIAGHVYETPGSYTVTLTVVNPAGASDIETAPITVLDPLTYFAETDVYCFANTAGTFQGCSLDDDGDGTCEAGESSFSSHCIASSDFDAMIQTNANADATDGGKRWIQLAEGDNYANSGGGNVIFYHQSTAPGLVSSFTSNADGQPNVTGSGIWPGRGWTFDNVAVTAFHVGHWDTGDIPSEPFQGLSAQDDRRNNVTANDVTVNFTTQCLEQHVNSVGDDRHVEWQAFIGLACVWQSGTGYKNYTGQDYALFLGSLFTNSNTDETGGAEGATFRAEALRWAAFAHNDLLNAETDRAHFQVRSADYLSATVWNTEVENSSYIVIRDNFFEESGAADTGGRLCATSNCGTQAHTTSPHDILIESNFTMYDSRGPNFAGSYLWQACASDITIRNNVWDMQGGVGSGNPTSTLAIVQHDGNSGGSGCSTAADSGVYTGGVQVYNNTVFDDTALPGGENLEGLISNSSADCTTATCLSRSNLFVWANYAGDSTPNGDPTQVTTSNQLVQTTDTLSAPEYGLTQIDDFALPISHAAIDEGYDFSTGTDTSRWVYHDAYGFCRPCGDGWDIGAFEYESSVPCE